METGILLSFGVFAWKYSDGAKVFGIIYAESSVHARVVVAKIVQGERDLDPGSFTHIYMRT